MAKDKVDALVKLVLGLLSTALTIGGGVVTHELTRIDRDIAAVETRGNTRISGIEGRTGLLENHEIGTSRDIGAQGNAINDLKGAIKELDSWQRAHEATIGKP